MLNRDDDLVRVMERKIPHMTFLMHVFASSKYTHATVWHYERFVRFNRLKKMMLSCWDTIQSMARQMAGSRAFYRMYQSLRRSVVKIRLVEESIFRAFEPKVSSVWKM